MVLSEDEFIWALLEEKVLNEVNVQRILREMKKSDEFL